ncbi:hypothetical protein QWZ13_16155 [Reinekea marina]|uniref:hypothetical protein n=1 Tax=Reinekea marina TaxID=1310421 RepID=UPI0025B407DF|nr:hypothetical protein [Reinekea marina]MDN3650442.1 hypothetical protein [Reinekea marina]
MGNVQSLAAFKKAKTKAKAAGVTLCKNGHHKWSVEKETTFDSKQGKLVSRYRCVRCNKTKVSSS